LGRTALTRSRQLAGAVLAVLAPAVMTVLGLVLRTHLSLSTDVVGYFLVVVLVALVGGLGPAVAAAFISAGLLNFFFTEPYYTLLVAVTENVITPAAILIVA